LTSIYKKLTSILFIFCLGTIVYSNTFFCPFHFDDTSFIVDNSFIKNIHDLHRIWSFYPCRFITFITLAFNYHFNHLEVSGYHLFNLGVHLISAVMVWWLVLLTFSTSAMKNEKITPHANSIALLAGLVFVSHPVQTEAVTYIWQRAASLVALLYVASLCFYVQSRLLQDRNKSPNWPRFLYACSLITAVLAMFTKEDAITLPVMVMLYEFSFFKAKGKGRFNWRATTPFLFTLIIIPLTLHLTKSVMSQRLQLIVGGSSGISPMHYFLSESRVIVTYLRLVFVPINQNLDYDFPTFNSIFQWPVLISFLFLAGVLYFAKRLFLRYRLVSFSIFWFFLTLLPESSFLPLQDLIFEHRLYLPLVGFSIFLVTSLFYLFEKKGVTMVIIALAAVIACNSFLTYQRNKIWKDDFTLWNDSIHKSPLKARPYNNRGLDYERQNDFTRALSDYDRALELKPNFIEAYNNRGTTYDKLGKFAQAIADYNKALALNPQYAEIYNNRGSAKDKLGQWTQAIADYNKAIELNPDHAESYNNRGSIYDKLGQYHEAILDFDKAIALNPIYLEAINNRASVNEKLGSTSQAITGYNKAIEINPRFAQAYYNRGLTFEKQGDEREAMSNFNKAIALEPQYAKAYCDRGLLYYKLGKFSEAMSDFNKAIEINPKFAEAYNNRGSDWVQEGDLTQALGDYNKAIALDPHYAQAYSNRGLNFDKQGMGQKALADLNKAIELDPQYTDAYINRGNAFAKQNNLIQAISDYTKVIDINPGFALAYENRAILYYQLKDYDKAWADVHKIERSGQQANQALISALKQASAMTIDNVK